MHEQEELSSLWSLEIFFSRLVVWLYCMASVFARVPDFWPQN